MDQATPHHAPAGSTPSAPTVGSGTTPAEASGAGAGVVAVRGVVLGQGRPKVIVPLMPTTSAEVPAAVAALDGQPVDLIEWRVDHVADPELAVGVGVALRTETGLPLLTTYRTDREGGLGALPDTEYAALLQRLVRLDLADAVDVEYRRDADAVRIVIEAAHRAGLPVVTSFHDFGATPNEAELLTILGEQAAAGGDVLKIAVTPTTPVDVATLLSASARAADLYPGRALLTISMGPLGLVSRVAAETFGSCATFATVGQASAPGQIPVGELVPLLERFSRD